MQKKSKTTTVYRLQLEKGNYTTISRQILMNPNLSDSAKTLLQIILNNTDDWKLVLEYYRKLLGWSFDKLSYAVANLIENGYLKKQKHSKGKDKGFYYTYIISEFGNLNPDKEKPDEDEILETLKEVEEDEQNGDSIQQESNHEIVNVDEPVQENIVSVEEPMLIESIQPEESKPFVIDEVFRDKVYECLKEELVHPFFNQDFTEKVAEYYTNQIKTGKLVAENYDEQALRKTIREKKAKRWKEKDEELNNFIDFHNDKGTKHQREVIKAKALRYFNDIRENGDDITEYEVGTRVLLLKTSVIQSNLNLDQRYQN